MAKIVSSAGEMEMSMVSIGVESDNIVMRGKMGVWDAKVLIPPEEAMKTIGMMLNFSLILYTFKLPFILLRKKNRS